MLDFREFIAGAESYAEMARDVDEDHIKKKSIVASTIFAWSAIEAFVNSRLEDFATVADRFELHEQALLYEKRITFIDKGQNAGKFELIGKDYRTLENKIMFLLAKFGKGLSATNLNKGDSLWQSFQNFKEARDSFAHPRNNSQQVSIEDLDEYIKTAKEVIKTIGNEIWGEKIEF